MALDTRALRDAVSRFYAGVVENPASGYPFHTGPEYAAGRLGYPRGLLAQLPAAVTAPFAGVGNPLSMGMPRPGAVVVDVGPGSGLDTFLAARAVGARGAVIAVDMTDAVLEHGWMNVLRTRLTQIEFRKGFAEALPVDSGCADLVISNGAIVLCPDKPAVFREAFRVLRPGGRLQLADVVVRRALPAAMREDLALWTARIGGAMPEDGYLAAIGQAGFRDVEVTWRGKPFAGAPGEATAERFEAEGINVLARKP